MVLNVDKFIEEVSVKRGIFPIIAIVICILAISCSKKPPKLDTKPCNKAKGYFQLGVSYMNADDPISALEQLFKAEKLCPHDSETQNAIGLIYFSKERFEKSIKHFKLALAAKPDYSDAHHNLGVVYLYLNQYDDAINSFTLALQNDLYRNQANSLNALGWAYYKKKDYVNAEKYFKETLEHDRLYLPSYDNLGKVYMALNRFEDALVPLDKAISLNANYVEAIFDRGVCFFKLGLKNKAKSDFEKVKQLDPLGKFGIQSEEYLKLME